MKDWQQAHKREQDDKKAFQHALRSGHAGVPAPKHDDSEVGSLQKKTKLNLRIAKKYAPRNTLLFHDPKVGRIRGYMEKGRGKSHGCNLSVGHDMACRVVLSWLWKQHLKMFPQEECRHDFSFDLAP